MNFDRYAGLASAVGIILILMVVTWLDLWGPIDFSKLEKWQTLIAGITTGSMALVAATIAYIGATAKVRYDRKVVERDDNRRKLALYLKIEFAFEQVIEKSRSLGVNFMFGPAVGNHIFSARNFHIDEPPELEEAWASLDIFPRHLIAEIRNVRNSIRKMTAMKVELGDKTVSLSSELADKPWIIEQAGKLTDEIWHSAAIVMDELKPLIQELAPEMDESERLTKIYGEPGPHDFDP
jgi:hypothetical protein